jgi:3-phenylpropionate/trans-cinnamate dioxygenase ferredoxin reductase subunit
VPGSASTAAAIVIAGAGECGTRAAFALREQGVPYRSLLVATGARARRLPFGGAPVHVLRTHTDSAALRGQLAPGRRVAVIGGGFIGLELASSAAALGCAVTVIELGPRLMGRAVPARVAAVMAQRHVAAGVDIRCGTGVTGLAGTASGVMITLAEGGIVEADVVVAGVGAAPETSLAEAAGIEVADGIVVDARFATSAWRLSPSSAPPWPASTH